MFHPVVQHWLERKFGAPTPAQAQAWPLIASGKDVLVTAPTGSGKTLAAFLWALDRLVGEAIAAGGTLPDRTSVLYVSPLKALSNDVRRNLEEPLGEIKALAAELGYAAPEVRTAVRTGDGHDGRERREATRRPPHVLVTTPESLYILLTSESGRKALRDVRTVIVDEIHAVAPDKRGAHLALSLERLEALVSPARLQRIGLSATVRPLDVASRLLVGGTRPPPAVVDVGQRRDLDLGVEVPEDELGAVATNEQWAELYDRIADPGARAQVDAGVRQHAPPGRAGHAASRRASRDRQRRRPPRQPLARAPPPGRAPLESGRPQGRRGDGLAGARHRRRRRRALLLDRLAALDRHRAAADRSLRPRARRHPQGSSLPAHPRPAGRVRGAGPRGPAGRHRRRLPAGRAARRAVATDRRRLRLRGMGRGRALRALPARGALRRPLPRRFRRRGRHALRGDRHQPGALGRAPAPRRGQPAAARATRARASPRSPPAAPSPTTPTTTSSSSPTGRRSGPSTKTSPSSRWRATSSCWEIPPGASAASSPARSASRTHAARRPPSRFGWARGRPAHASCRPRSRRCATRSSTPTRAMKIRRRP